MRLLFLAAILLPALQSAAAEPAGIQKFTIPAEHHEGKMSGALWYPSAGGGEAISYGDNAVFFGTPALDGARMAEGRFPVILASHGLGGNIGSISWLTAGLAEAGATRHFGQPPEQHDMGLRHPGRPETLDASAGPPGRARLAHRPTGSCCRKRTFPGSTLSAFPRAAGRRCRLVDCGPTFWDTPRIAEPRHPRPGNAQTSADAGPDLAAYSAGDWDASRKDDRIRAVAAIDPVLTYGLGRIHARDLVEQGAA